MNPIEGGRMNVVDRIQLELLLTELTQARVLAKDAHAEALIRRTLEQQPDAAYLLAQRVMQLESALCGARAAGSGGAVDTTALHAGDEPADVVERRIGEPWWRQPIDLLYGTAVLLQSAAYLLGGRTTGQSA